MGRGVYGLTVAATNALEREGYNIAKTERFVEGDKPCDPDVVNCGWDSEDPDYVSVRYYLVKGVVPTLHKPEGVTLNENVIDYVGVVVVTNIDGFWWLENVHGGDIRMLYTTLNGDYAITECMESC